MLAASFIALALNTVGPANQATPIGYFKAAISEKDVEAKCDLIENGLGCLLHIDADKNGEELDRLFTLYLGFLAADLPFHINCTIAQVACMLRLSDETRSLAVEALDGYLVKLKASKEDVAPPRPTGPFTGIGHGQKPSQWLEGQYLSDLKSEKTLKREKK